LGFKTKTRAALLFGRNSEVSNVFHMISCWSVDWLRYLNNPDYTEFSGCVNKNKQIF
jgi:hypothetical protein